MFCIVYIVIDSEPSLGLLWRIHTILQVYRNCMLYVDILRLLYFIFYHCA